MVIEIIEENQYVAQVRFICDQCSAQIGTRIMLKKEVEAQNKKEIVCPQCKQKSKQPNASIQSSQQKILRYGKLWPKQQ